MELKKVLLELKDQRYLKRFLIAFFFFDMGVQTVMYVAAIFGETELHIPGDNLIITVLLIQLLAIPGSEFAAWLSGKIGNTGTLAWIVLIWILICVAAVFTNQTGFYILAGIIGFVMGAVQSLSRATYAKLMPADTSDRASYFGFYDMMDKSAIVLGTFSYGLIEQLSGSVRVSVGVLGIFFFIGLLVLWMIPSNKSYSG